MADQKHRKILEYDVKKLNEWRHRNSDIKLNLTSSYLSGVDLSFANLSEADLSEADLTETNLSFANLTEANLTGAYLSFANLTEACLTGANLTGANLAGACLTGANLTGTNLAGACLTGAGLTGVNLSGAIISATVFSSKSQIDILTISLLEEQIAGARFLDEEERYREKKKEREAKGHLKN